MRHAFLLLCLSFATSALADGPPPLAGVGVLEKDGKRSCSAVLIAPARLVTAAHCVAWNKQAVAEGEFEILFHTGAYRAHPTEAFRAKSVLVHPRFFLTSRTGGARAISADVALVDLAVPVPPNIAHPLPVGPPITEDEQPLIASWPSGQGGRARERRCAVVEVDPNVAQLSCIVVPGESGGAALRITEDGAELAGIIAATSRTGRQPLGLVVQAQPRLRQMQAIYGD